MTVKWSKDYYVVELAYASRQYIYGIAGAEWNKTHKVWRVPKIQYKNLLAAGFEVDPKDKAKIEAEQEELIRRLYLTARLKKAYPEGYTHPFLMPHQEMGRQIAEIRDKYCFFYDTGTGKTIMALSIMADKPEIKWLVVCPIVLVKNAWLEDAKHYPSIKLLPLTTNMKKKDYVELCNRYEVKYSGFDSKDTLIEKLDKVCTGYIINPESFHKFDKEVQGLIFDESVLLKSPTAQITKRIVQLTKGLKHTYLLSGEPAPNTEEDYFSQLQIVEAGLWGNYITQFRDRYFRQVDLMGYKRVMRDDKKDAFFKGLERFCTFMTKEQCLDLPEHTTRVIKFDLSDKVMKQYKEMEKLAILEVEEAGIDIQADFLLTKLMKLRQITSGFVLTEEGPKHLHTEKLDVLKQLLEQLGTKQVIIWINFQEEVRLIGELLTKMGKTYVTAYGGTADKDESITDFKAGTADVIIAHPQTLKYGVTLTNCTYSIKYSLSYSYDDFKQSQDRINRKGKTLPTTEYLLTATRTIDEVLVRTIMDKKHKADLVKDVLEAMKDEL